VNIQAPSQTIAAGDIWPDSATVSPAGRLEIGGCDTIELAAEHGTPLYVFDEAAVLTRMRGYRDALAAAYPGDALVCYASKAYAAPWIARHIGAEGLGLDVVSEGELRVGLLGGVDPARIYVHGNNKGRSELQAALDAGVGRIVVDNLDELDLLAELAAARGVRQPILLRVGPGVDAHTHAHLTTGALDTKFGLGIAAGQAAEGVRAAVARPSLDLRGIHCHIGSQIAEVEPYEQALDRLFAFAAEMRDSAGLDLREISPGGGYGVRYSEADPTVDAREMIATVGRIVREAAGRHGYGDRLPALTIEPGRSLVATTAVALYRVGSVKAIPGGRTYVAVDGGMADNIRPTAYGSLYTAALANRAGDPADAEVAIAGRYCETGDILIQRITLPLPRVGDLVAIPAAGAYQLAMASNYNLGLRPAVVAVAAGRSRLVRRRETYADLLAPEIVDEGA
jgi:diaminopimelate decarboxylase